MHHHSFSSLELQVYLLPYFWICWQFLQNIFEMFKSNFHLFELVLSVEHFICWKSAVVFSIFWMTCWLRPAPIKCWSICPEKLGFTLMVRWASARCGPVCWWSEQTMKKMAFSIWKEQQKLNQTFNDQFSNFVLCFTVAAHDERFGRQLRINRFNETIWVTKWQK